MSMSAKKAPTKADLAARLTIAAEPESAAPSETFPQLSMDRVMDLITAGKYMCIPVEITPEVAAGLLTLNRRNRPIKARLLRAYTAAMKAGKWEERNGQTVSINTEGDVDNGQHRLRSCVDAGRPFRTLIVFGNAPGAFETIDQHGKRSASDTLAVDHHQNYSKAAATLRQVYLYEKDSSISQGAIPPEDVRPTMAAHPGLDAAVSAMAGTPALHKLGPPAVVGFAFYMFAKSDPAKFDEFITLMRTGANMSEDHPVLRLRNAMVNRASGRAGVNTSVALALWIKAWNLFKAGGTCQSLQYRAGGEFPEKFPRVM